jgi:hypothetical protein
MEITKEDFMDYENVRLSGKTNMFDVSTVIRLSKNLNREKIKYIMFNYSKLKEEFSDKNERN